MLSVNSRSLIIENDQKNNKYKLGIENEVFFRGGRDLKAESSCY